MRTRCEHCSFVYERAPGYFLGSAYLNYGFMALTLTPLYMGLHFGLGWSNQALALPLAAYCIVIPILLFRYARAWWLAMDCMLDTTHFHEGDPTDVRLPQSPIDSTNQPPRI